MDAMKLRDWIEGYIAGDAAIIGSDADDNSAWLDVLWQGSLFRIRVQTARFVAGSEETTR